MKKGFTLTELLICIAVVGVLAMVLLPVLSSKKTNKEMLAFRKAYNSTAKIVYDMMQSTGYYSGDFSDTSETAVPIDGKKPKDDAKFCEIFASYLNTKGNVTCSGEGPHFTTLDGIQWTLPISDFKENGTITVDVNGNKEPNCSFSADNCPEPDQFSFVITPGGKIIINDTKALEYLEDDTQAIKSR